MSASIYAVELFSEFDPKKTPIRFEFEIMVGKKSTMPPSEHKVKVVSIGSGQLADEYAIAKTINYEYAGTVLQYIYYNGESYRPANHSEFWFPKTTRPVGLTQDSMLLYIDDSDHAVVVPLIGGLSYLTSTGVFCEEYVMVKRRVKDGNWIDCDIHVLIFDAGTASITMLDRDTKTTRSIKFATTFNEMPIIGIAEQ